MDTNETLTDAQKLKRYELRLRAADAVMKAIDEAIKNGSLNPRHPIADARLDFGQPHIYEHTKR